MDEENSQAENTQDQSTNRHPTEHLKPWQFKPGQSGNPGGRPKGTKSLKQFAQEMLRDMSDEEKLQYLKGLDKDKIWEMGEGKPKADVELSGEVKAKIISVDE